MQDENDTVKSKPSRKRPRLEKVPSSSLASKNEHKQGDKEGEEEEEEVLTPHTLRLLKLIEEGSTEHAQLAATHLSAITSQSSPIVLWDILGRLQFFLNSADWRTRQNASVAMEGVARHLPIWDQRAFLQETTALLQEEEHHVWLTLADLKGKMGVILQKGRSLLAFSDEVYGEDEQLEKLDQDLKGSAEFCEQRLQLQRKILARRLGLSDVMIYYNGQGVVDQVLSSSDDLNEKTLPRTKKKAKETDLALQKSFRALLVMEIRQQQDGGNEPSTVGIVSHRKSQMLLAGELVYRMFDASWHVRHGSLMGILALIRAWKVHQSADSFGNWPHDLLARTVCLMGLDRFADYSGASMESTGGAVAPVREMAGQVFSAIFPIAPERVQRDSFDVLKSLASDADWEVRHGALVSMKYCVALMCSNTGEPLIALQQTLLKDTCDLAVERLEDESDDVQSVAAQLLGGTHAHNIAVPDTIQPLWRSIERSSFVSSSIKDLVNLFAVLTTRDCEAVLENLVCGTSKWNSCRRILLVLEDLLSCEYASVRGSVLRTIGSLVNSLPTSLVDSESDKRNVVEVSKCFSQIVLKVFNLYLDQLTSTDDERAVLKQVDTFLGIWNESWGMLTKASKNRILLPHNDLSLLHVSLLLQYFSANGVVFQDLQSSGLHQRSKASHGNYLQRRLQSAKSLGRFLLEDPSDYEGNNREVLYFCLRACTESPCIFQFESSCFLFQALVEHLPIGGISTTTISIQQSILEALETKPCCLDYQATEGSVSDSNHLRLWMKAFSHGIEMVRMKGADGLTAAGAVVELWKDGAPAPTGSRGQATIDSMRVVVSATGALITCGCRFLPTKLTPLVRALMTSIQNEGDPVCQSQTCFHLSSLLRLLLDDVQTERASAFKKTFSKILSNLCKSIKSNQEPGSSTAARTIGSFANGSQFRLVQMNLDILWTALKPVANYNGSSLDPEEMRRSLCLLRALCHDLQPGSELSAYIIDTFAHSLVELRCVAGDSTVREASADVIKSICSIERCLVLEATLPRLAHFLQNNGDASWRLRSCYMLRDILEVTSLSICPYVRTLLPLVMPLMTDSNDLCAKAAATMFSRLVQVAPLVKENAPMRLAVTENQKNAELVMQHLIHGEPIPPCDIKQEIASDLRAAGVHLRGYQLEGVSWLRFLQTVHLNGALCDSMGLGKTLQALVSVASSHLDAEKDSTQVSLVVCPSSVVGHWVNEVKRFFPHSGVLKPVAIAGPVAHRKTTLSNAFRNGNIVITSYAALRTDVDMLAQFQWRYCILDEGHLLKNPKTATARASKRLICRHKLVLSGTPVQNKVHEVWATFDFLMPNFLGSSASFSREFAKPITKSQGAGASASDIANGIECLKSLHQQVLPFILRREKEHVLKELPPKSVSVIPCQMSPLQKQIYDDFSASGQAQSSLHSLQNALKSAGTSIPKLGKDVLKSLLFLRLLCTHPILTVASQETASNNLEHSGKLVALSELLRDAGIQNQGLVAADNDPSLLYCDDSSDDETDDFDAALETGLDESLVALDNASGTKGGSRCLIFAQFMSSLDIVETSLLKRFLPSVAYLRLDGLVPAQERSKIVDRFNEDEDVKILLLTTRVGGLGLNLTGADTVIFLEHDWNPHADMQAMDRAHRIGQKKTVHVYKLVTSDSIEEHIMKIHDTKLAMANSIVNTDNSSMFSLGTDRLLDIFKCRSEVSTRSSISHGLDRTLDALVDLYEEEYKTLSIETFIEGLKDESARAEGHG